MTLLDSDITHTPYAPVISVELVNMQFIKIKI